MNPGYLALIVIWFLILLTWIGCFDRYLQINHVKKSIVMTFLIISLFGTWYTQPLVMGGRISFVSFLLPLAISWFMWLREDDNIQIHLLTASFLIGTSIFLLRLLLQIDPVLMFINEHYMQVALTLFLLVVAARGFTQQFILLVFGLTFGEVGFQYYLWEKTSHFQLGSLDYSDLWWLTIASLICLRWLKGRFKWHTLWKRKGAETT
jgi:hypothetical protein